MRSIKIISHVTLTAILCVLAINTSSATYKQKPLSCSLGKESALPGRIYVGNLNQPFEKGLFEDYEEMCRIFGARPHMFYIDDSSGENAYAQWALYPEFIRAEGGNPNIDKDGTIAIGLNLLKNEYARTYGSGMSIPAILAHEFGHIIQFKNGLNMSGRWRELHADFIAGWFIGHRSRFRTQDVNQAMLNFYYKGSSDFHNPGTHGTASERANAFLAGYKLNREQNVASGSTAYNTGLQYVKSQGAPITIK